MHIHIYTYNTYTHALDTCTVLLYRLNIIEDSRKRNEMQNNIVVIVCLRKKERIIRNTFARKIEFSREKRAYLFVIPNVYNKEISAMSLKKQSSMRAF